MMKMILPPYTLTPSILKKCQHISYLLGVLEGQKMSVMPIKLRKEHKIKKIQSTLAIEGNTLTIEQVTGLLEGKRIIGPAKDIMEVNNALQVYADLTQWDPLSEISCQRAHQILMQGLISNPGAWRTQGMGIFKGQQVAHVAPSAAYV
jgi:Fic family protein